MLCWGGMGVHTPLRHMLWATSRYSLDVRVYRWLSAKCSVQKRPASTPPSVEAQMGQGARQAHPMPTAGAAPLDHPMHALTLRAPSPSPDKALHEDQIAGAVIPVTPHNRWQAGALQTTETDWLRAAEFQFSRTCSRTACTRAHTCADQDSGTATPLLCP